MRKDGKERYALKEKKAKDKSKREENKLSKAQVLESDKSKLTKEEKKALGINYE